MEELIKEWIKEKDLKIKHQQETIDLLNKQIEDLKTLGTDLETFKKNIITKVLVNKNYTLKFIIEDSSDISSIEYYKNELETSVANMILSADYFSDLPDKIIKIYSESQDKK